jgi:hypothetical protein
VTEPRVRVQHLRVMRERERTGWCVPGARAWCERYGISWEGFVRDGVPCSDVEATGDHFGLTLAALAREEAEGGR